MSATERIAKIESTFLGRQDHGIMTATLQVSYGGTGQGVGGFALDAPPTEGAREAGRRRVGTAYGMEWVVRCMDACGVDSWEKIKGRTIMVLFADDSWGAQPIGIAPLPTEPGKPFLFASLEWDGER